MRAWRFVVPLIALMIFAACGGDDDDNRPPDVERFELTSGLSESDPLVPGGFVNIEVWLDDPDGVGDVDSSKVFFYDGYLWIRLERDPTDRSHFRATHDIPCPDYLGAHLGAVKVYDKHGNKDKQKFSIYYVTSCEMCNEPPELGQIYYWVNETLDEGMTYGQEPVEVFDFDELGVTFDYEDPDCNLEGGEFWYNLDEAGWQKFENLLPEWLGCSSEQSDQTYGMILPTDELGEHTWQVYWEDACGSHSNLRTGSYLVKN